jgi:hypothetical protein
MINNFQHWGEDKKQAHAALSFSSLVVETSGQRYIRLLSAAEAGFRVVEEDL